MKILSIVWYKVLPALYGGQKGIAGFNKHLSKHASLVCLCSFNNKAPDGLPYQLKPELPVSKWQFLSRACLKMISRIAREESITHIILEHPYHGLAAVKAKKSTGARLIVHSHNIESERFRQLGKWWWKLLYLYERWTHRKADLSLFKTELDLQWAVRHFKLEKDKCMIVPYGINKTERIDRLWAKQTIRDRHQLSPEEKILLFAGTLDYTPNFKAIENIFSQIVPRLKTSAIAYRIIICGKNPNPSFSHRDPMVLMTGEVSDIELYFAAADVFINPVQSGGGIQTKNLEALAQHCNVVCFDTMTDESLAQSAGSKFFVSPGANWNSFVQQTEKAALYESVTPAEFFAKYSWETITANLASRMRAI